MNMSVNTHKYIQRNCDKKVYCKDDLIEGQTLDQLNQMGASSTKMYGSDSVVTQGL